MRRIAETAMLLLGSMSLSAQGTHGASLSESLSRTHLASPSIAPDGHAVAYRVRETDWKNNEFVWQLWLADASSGHTRQLTRGRKSAGEAQWSPDGRWLAFITEREANGLEAPDAAEAGGETAKEKDAKKDEAAKPAGSQVWVIAADGGEAWQASRAAGDVQAVRWSGDGRWLIYSAKAAETPSQKARAERYSGYSVIEQDYRQTQLWRLDMSAALPLMRPVQGERLIDDRALNVEAFDVSADGSRVVFGATKTPLLARMDEQQIYLLDVAAHRTEPIVALPGPQGEPRFSPDGRQIVFGTALAQPYFFYANGHLASVDLARVAAHPASGVPDVRDLTRAFDEDPQLIGWTPNGIYFSAIQKMTARLFRLEPSSLKIEPLSPAELIVEDVSVTPDGQWAAFSAADATHLSELYIASMHGGAPRRLTDQTAQIAGWALGTVEPFRWKSKDGTSIEGVLHKPAGFDPKRRYPLLVKIHGGPTGVSQPALLPPDYAYPLQTFLSKGALVLEPNYRGSAGYGSAFRALNVRNLGVGDMWDVMSGVDALIAQGIADPERLAAMGWSQGGYISAFLTTHTDRFKAISVGAGISDWSTYYVSTDITPFTRQYLHATPWDDPAIYAKTSPITTIRQAKTPTLIQHGSEDQRVPVPDAFELYRGLKDQKVEARLILYNGFGHGINKPKSALALLQANLDWFSHFLWSEPIPRDSPLNGESELPAGP